MDLKQQIRDNEKSTRETYQCVCARQPSIDGCVRYRQDAVVKGVGRRNRDMIWIMVNQYNEELFYWTDLIYGLQVNKMPTPCYPVWDWCKLANVKLVMDYNDDVFNIPASNPARKMTDEEKKAARELIQHCDAMTCTVEPMRKVIQPDNSNIAIIPNYFDMATYEHLLTPPDEAEMRWKDRKKKTVIGYVGAANHTEDQDIFFKAIVPIMRERSDVEIAMFGVCPTKIMDEFGESRVHVTAHCTLEEYYPRFCQMGIDILCNPLVKSDFNACKSNIKWLEGSYFGAAIISSPIPAYKNLGDDICMTVDWAPDEQLEVMEWRQCIEHLIDDPQDRWNRVATSQRWMADEWDIAVKYKNWVDVFSRVLNNESIAGLDYTPRREEVTNEIQGGKHIPVIGDADRGGGSIRVNTDAEVGTEQSEVRGTGGGC